MSNQSSTPRRIAKIIINDVLAIEDAEIDVPSDGLKIIGPTGSGKTTILDCIQAVLDSNVRKKMVRQGADHGNILLVMSDGMTAGRKISDSGKERAIVKGANGKPIEAPATFLKKLAPALLLNPVKFVDLDETQKAKVLAEVFPVELSQEELEAICGDDVDLQGVDPTANGLARANQAYKAAYVARHGVNGKLELAESSRDAERKKIPEGFDAESVRSLSSEAIATELGRIETHNQRVAEGAKQMLQFEGNEKTLNAEIENLQKELAAKQANLTEVKTRLEKGRKWLEDNKHIDPATTQAQLKTLDQQRMYLHCFDQAEAYEKQRNDIAAQALRLDAIVASLKALPGDLVRRSKIPIDGLTIEDGIVHVNGLPINNLSEGEQYQIAVRVAAAGTTELPIVCIDGAEKMSTVKREKLIDDLAALGIQVFYTVAEECDFNVLDLKGNPTDAKISIPGRVVPAPITAAISTTSQPARSVTAPKVAAKVHVTAEVAKPAATKPMPDPFVKPARSLFETAPEEEALFGEPTI